MLINRLLLKPFKGFNTRLYFILLLILLTPTIYKTLRIYYLGDLPSDNGFNVASQIIWLNVVVEMVQESLIIPLFFLFGKTINNTKILDNKIKTGLITTGSVYLMLILFIYSGAEGLLNILAQKESIISISSQYIKLEAVSIFLSVIYRFILIVLILLNKIRQIFLLLILQTTFTSLSDSLLISQLSFSMNYGVLGIAYGNILVNFLLVLASIYILIRNKIIFVRKTKLDFAWQKEWLKVGGFSGLESIIRNTIFLVFIIRWINMVEGQSYFWISNTFIWSWLLVPVMALGELIKKEVGENNLRVKPIIKQGLAITSIITIIWLFSIPFWGLFFKKVLNIPDPDIVFEITIMALLFYIAFAYNHVIDSVFYGLGRTDLMLIQSIIVNILYYGIVYLLVMTNFVSISLYLIVAIFGVGILLDSLITFSIYLHVSRKGNLIRKTLPL